MKRLLPLIAVGALALSGAAFADSSDTQRDHFDVQMDRTQIQNSQHDIARDKAEQQRDLRHGDIGGAIGEQREIDHSQAQLPAEKRDLREDRYDLHLDRD